MFVWLHGHEDISAARAAFHSDGLFFVKDLFPRSILSAFVDEIAETLRYLLKARGVVFDQNASLDELYNCAWDSLGENRRFLSTLPGDLISFSALVGHTAVQTLMKNLFETEAVQTVSDSNVLRVDRPRDDSTILTWHQDFPYNVLAEDAATVWAPILPVTAEMGRMQVVPGNLTIRPVDLVRNEKKIFHSSSYFKLSGLEQQAKFFASESVELPEVGVGDAVVQHSLLLHASGKNRSGEKSRWVFTARYADVHRKQSAHRTWLTARAKYPFFFNEAYPEYVNDLGSN